MFLMFFLIFANHVLQITKRGEVVSEEMFRISHARREHKKHVRELLAQAIVHKTLDLEVPHFSSRTRIEETFGY